MKYKTPKDRMRFYKSKEWRQLRQQVLEEQNHECQECKRLGRVTLIDPTKHKTLDVDHIKELSTHPKLALEKSNLRVLCIPHHNEKHDRWIKVKQEPKFMNEERW